MKAVSTNQDKMEAVFDKTPPLRLLVKLSVPSVLTTMIMLLYNLADTFFVGQTGDSLQVAAVALCAPVFSLISALGMLFGNGGSIRCSILLGERKTDRVRSVFAFCGWGSLAVGVTLSVGMLAFQQPLLHMLGASPDTYRHAQGYLSIMLAGIPLMMFSQAMSSVLRADGNVKGPMYGNVLASITNIVLDPIFILLLNWGVRGAAFATVLANGINCLYLILLIQKRPSYFTMNIRAIRWRWSDTGGALLLGVPMMISTLLTSFSGVLTNGFLSGYGDLYLAANGVSSKLRMIITMLIMGICMGIQPGISYYFGARQRDKLDKLLKVTGGVSVVIGSALAVVFFLMRDSLVAVFLDDPDVIVYGGQMVLGCVLSGPVQGIYQLSTNYLQGTGSVTMATVLAVLRQALHIPIMILGNFLFGFLGVVYSAAVATFLCAFIGLILSRIQSNKIWKLPPAEPEAAPEI